MAGVEMEREPKTGIRRREWLLGAAGAAAVVLYPSEADGQTTPVPDGAFVAAIAGLAPDAISLKPMVGDAAGVTVRYDGNTGVAHDLGSDMSVVQVGDEVLAVTRPEAAGGYLLSAEIVYQHAETTFERLAGGVMYTLAGPVAVTPHTQTRGDGVVWKAMPLATIPAGSAIRFLARRNHFAGTMTAVTVGVAV